MDGEELNKTKRAGEMHKKVVAYAKEIVKPGVKLIDIANKIDDKIAELGKEEIVGKRAESVGPAFAVTLCIDDVAAHATPAVGDEEVARGLLKVDIGVQVDGYVADGAFSVDLEDNDENKKLIDAAEAGLKVALETVGIGVSLGKVGKNVQESIKIVGERSGLKFVPIENLSGHQIKQYDLHAGLNVPSYDSGEETQLEEGVYAIEPFATNGEGRVKNGRPSGIYKLVEEGNVRDNFAREVLDFIVENYQTLPFCSRWIVKKFGARGMLALRQIENAGMLHHYPQLVEAAGGKVAQAEHTVIIKEDGEKVVTTK
jgi:methionyl aminopeptidase